MKNIKLLKTVIIAAAVSIMLLGFNLADAATNKPKVDDLLYPFKTHEATVTGQEATTDYIASLPQTASPMIFIGKIAFFMLIVANILAFLSFVGSGIFMIISMGDAEMLKKAKNIFTNTIIAMLICATALAVVTGITQLQFFNP